MTSIVAHRRRNLIFGRAPDTPNPIRPPWTREATVLAACTGCGACARACPEHIVEIGAGGLPRVDLDRGECTFCGACAEVCQEPVFAPTRGKQQAFAHAVRIGERCLALRDVVCRSCADICPESAVGFSRRLGGPDAPNINGDRCTGCGACIGICPAGAIGVDPEVADHG